MCPQAGQIGALLPADCSAALLCLSQPRGFLAEHIKQLASLPAHGNRKLFPHHLLLGLLFSFFDPMARSLRTIEDKKDFDGRLDLPRLARSTTADALAACDPQCLMPLFDDLRRRVPQLAQEDPDLAGITRLIIAADGTYLRTLAQVAWALYSINPDGKKQRQVRANVQMDVATWCPQVISISGDDGKSEPAAFVDSLLEDAIYVVDRNFVNFDFLKALLHKRNDFVVRIKRGTPSVKVLDKLPLSAADVEAGVQEDLIVSLSGRNAPAGRFRLVTVHAPGRDGKVEVIRLLSSLNNTAIAAYVIGAIYRQRWQIELFFKWFKTFARLDHLLSTSVNGITFQLYVAVIGVLMMYVQSGRRVSIYALAALSRLARGECTLQQAMEVIAHRERERELNRLRQARKRAMKKLS